MHRGQHGGQPPPSGITLPVGLSAALLGRLFTEPGALPPPYGPRRLTDMSDEQARRIERAVASNPADLATYTYDPVTHGWFNDRGRALPASSYAMLPPSLRSATSSDDLNWRPPSFIENEPEDRPSQLFREDQRRRWRDQRRVVENARNDQADAQARAEARADAEDRRRRREWDDMQRFQRAERARRANYARPPPPPNETPVGMNIVDDPIVETTVLAMEDAEDADPRTRPRQTAASRRRVRQHEDYTDASNAGATTTGAAMRAPPGNTIPTRISLENRTLRNRPTLNRRRRIDERDDSGGGGGGDDGGGGPTSETGETPRDRLKRVSQIVMQKLLQWLLGTPGKLAAAYATYRYILFEKEERELIEWFFKEALKFIVKGVWWAMQNWRLLWPLFKTVLRMLIVRHSIEMIYKLFPDYFDEPTRQLAAAQSTLTALHESMATPATEERTTMTDQPYDWTDRRYLTAVLNTFKQPQAPTVNIIRPVLPSPRTKHTAGWTPAMLRQRLWIDSLLKGKHSLREGLLAHGSTEQINAFGEAARVLIATGLWTGSPSITILFQRQPPHSKMAPLKTRRDYLLKRPPIFFLRFRKGWDQWKQGNPIPS